MRVSLAEVRAMFDGLLAGGSREAASAWAVARMQATDAGGLTYDPPDAEARIWDAITFLGGADLVTDMVGSYLYGPIDFEGYRP